MKRFCAFALCGLFLACVMTAQAANPVPFLNQPLVPATVAPGSGAFTLTVNGTGFVSTSVVKWNGSARTTTFVSQSKLKAQILTTDVASAGSALVTVTSGGPASNTAFFFVRSSVSGPGFDFSSVLRAVAPSSVLVADLNGDNKPDLAITEGLAFNFTAQPKVGILLSNGDGTFQPPVSYSTVKQPVIASAGDFNGDGVPDLVVGGLLTDFVGSSFAYSVLLGNGDGTFQPAKNKALTDHYSTSYILVADFNRDGKLDLLVNPGGTIDVLLGNGDGTFQAPVTSTSGFPVTSVGDFNGDGILDIAGALQYALGNGDGSFQLPINLVTNGFPSQSTVADFNGDGILDVAGNGAGNVSICLGNGDGTFQPGMLFPSDVSGSANLLAVDLNGDGKLDLATDYTNAVTYLLGNGDGTFQNFVNLPTPQTGIVVFGDLNSDGRPDLVMNVINTQGGVGIFKLLQTP